MSSRRTASRLATVAAIAVASMGAPFAQAATPGGGFWPVITIVIGGQAYTLALSGILQQGGAG